MMNISVTIVSIYLYFMKISADRWSLEIPIYINKKIISLYYKTYLLEYERLSYSIILEQKIIQLISENHLSYLFIYQ